MLKESSDESIFSEDDCAKNQPTLNVKYFYWRINKSVIKFLTTYNFLKNVF